MIVSEGTGLFSELIPHRDGRLNNLDLSGPPLPFPGQVVGEPAITRETTTLLKIKGFKQL